VVEELGSKTKVFLKGLSVHLNGKKLQIFHINIMIKQDYIHSPDTI